MENIVVCSEKKELTNILDFINENLDLINPSFKFRMQLELSIEEIFVNIADYAYETKGDENKVDIKYCIEYDDKKIPSKIAIQISDSGKPYNPLENEDPNISLPSEEREIGGLGILLLKNNVDDIKYKYENGKNVLTIKKNIE